MKDSELRMKKKTGGRGALLVTLAALFWSFAGVLGKFTPWSALSLAGYRSVFAVLLLGLARKRFTPDNTRFTWIGAVGVTGTSLLFMFANKLTSSANAIVLQYAMTAIVIVVQIVFLKMKPRAFDIGAAVLVMAGVVLCFCQSLGKGRLLGDLLALLSAVTWATVFLAARMPGVDALSYPYQGNLLGCLFILNMPFDAGIAQGGAMGWLVASAMGMCLGLGYLFFAKGMQSAISPTAAAVVSNIEPVLNPLWVLLFLGEDPGLLSVLGCAVVLITVTVYSIRTGKRQ